VAPASAAAALRWYASARSAIALCADVVIAGSSIIASGCASAWATSGVSVAIAFANWPLIQARWPRSTSSVNVAGSSAVVGAPSGTAVRSRGTALASAIDGSRPRQLAAQRLHRRVGSAGPGVALDHERLGARGRRG
jgi:hypothetical protein